MRVYSESEEAEKLEFAKLAAERFKKYSDMYSFTLGNIVPGCFIALRWGLMDRAVLVLKLDEVTEPTVYPDMVLPDASSTET